MSFSPSALLLLPLIACKEPPLLDPVAAQLAAQLAATADPQIRLLTGVAGVVAESCTVSDMNGYTFSGATATALGVSQAGVVTSTSGDHTWTFAGAGIDGESGTLVVTADSTRSTFTTTYSSKKLGSVTGDYHVLACTSTGSGSDTGDTSGDTSGDTATSTGPASSFTVDVSGHLDFTATGSTDTSEALIQGDAPNTALTWAPPTAIAPTKGWVLWTNKLQNADEQILLEGAQHIDAVNLTWPGTASSTTGTVWSRSVTVGLP